MIRQGQLVAADDAAKAIAEAVTKLREVEDELARAGLFDHHSKLVLARGSLASVGLELRTSAREVFVALRQGKDVLP